MTETTGDDAALDYVERESLSGFIRPHFTAYLDFHVANHRHLPDNFAAQDGSSLGAEDSRRVWIDRVGFLSYSVFINLLLAWNTAHEDRQLPPNDVLGAYDLLSRVYLRIGAALDLSKLLAPIPGYGFANNKVQERCTVKALEEAPAILRKRVGSSDMANNFIKYSGLPALTLDDESAFVAPKRLSPDQKSWKQQNPAVEVRKLCKDAVSEALAAFCVFYTTLGDAVPAWHRRWALQKIPELISIADLPSHVTDGYYQPPTDSWATCPPSGVMPPEIWKVGH